DSSHNTIWALTDNEGTVRDWVNSSGNVVDHATYDSFGKHVADYNGIGQLLSSPAVDAVFGYTARYLDPLTGLQYNTERWYNPAAERWISEDPIGFAAGDASLYRYCGNAPTNYIDPSGLVEFPFLLTGNPNVWDRIWNSFFPPYSPVTVQLPDGTW